MSARGDVAVIGGGVIGLTTAVALAEAGWAVEIRTKETYERTTSANSGAVWGPFLNENDSRVLGWSYETFEVLKICSNDADSGVEMVWGLLAAQDDIEPPDWVSRLDGTRRCLRSELPQGHVCGWWYRVPIIDMPTYMAYLTLRFETLGGVVRRESVAELDRLEPLVEHAVICAGMGSRELVPDHDLVPSKGQLVVVSNPGISEFFAERGDGPSLTYILPQGEQVVLGGTAEWAYDNEEVDHEAARSIIERCMAVEPRLAQSSVLAHRVGIRPHRATVRLEHEVRAQGQHVVYNYGHGGSGVSVSWGCARAAQELIATCGASPSSDEAAVQ